MKRPNAIATAVASLALCMTLGATISACHRESAESLMAEAKQFQQKGDSRSAIIQLKNAVQQNPDNAEVRFMLASVYLDFGDPVSAEKEIRKAMSLGIKADRAIDILGKSLLQQGQPQKVLDETKPLEGSNMAVVAVLQGEAFLAMGRMAEAKNAYQNALKLRPNDTDALIGLARHAFAQHNIDDALQFSEDAVKSDPGSADAWLFKGDLLRSQHQSDRALAAYDHVLSIKPALRSARFSRAYIEIFEQKYDAAQADINAVKKSAPNNVTAFYLQAVLEFSRGKLDAAQEALLKVLRVAPEHLPSTLLLGAVEYQKGALKEAEHHLTNFLAKYPDSTFARKTLAKTLLKAGRPADSLAALKPALDNGSKDPQILATAGECYLQMRDYNKANSYFEEASNLAPELGILHTYIGLAKLAQGENDQAISELEQSAKMDTKSPKAGTVLVLTEIRLKHFDGALAAIKDMEKDQPNNPMLQNLRGGAYLGKNDIPNARASFEKAVAMQPTYFAAVNNLAQLDVRDKKPDAAKKRYQAFLEKDKKNIPAMNALANLAMSEGHVDEATGWLERANSENPDAVPAAIRLAYQYLQTGQKQKALTLALKYQVANPTNPELLDILGQVQVANKDLLAALETYSKLTGLVPNSAPAQLRLASVHSMLKNDAAAAEDLKKALALRPDFLQAEVAQALLALREENPDQAMAIARLLEKQHENLPAGYMLEGEVLLKQKKPDPAVRAYEHAFQLSPTTPVMIKMHTAMREAGQNKEADARMAAWQKAHPEDMQVVMYLAETNLADKQYKIAIEQLQAVLKAMPKNPLALNNLAWAYQQANDPRALATAEQAMQVGENNPRISDTLGWILVEQGNTTRGVPLLKSAAAAIPEDMDIRFHLASALAKAGDRAGAKRELQMMLAGGKKFSQEADARALLKQL